MYCFFTTFKFYQFFHQENNRTFATVNTMMKRHIASWMLLAVFVPMLLMASVHVHEFTKFDTSSCNECVQHHCHGHLVELTASMHTCLLCQFLTLTFVAAAVFAVALLNKSFCLLIAPEHYDLRHDVGGIPLQRAPPAV